MQECSSEEKLKKILINDYGYSVEELDICNGIMGVPISFLDKYCPEQFEIIGITNHGEMAGIPFISNCFAEVNGKRRYVRILIKRKEIDANGNENC